MGINLIIEDYKETESFSSFYEKNKNNIKKALNGRRMKKRHLNNACNLLDKETNLNLEQQAAVINRSIKDTVASSPEGAEFDHFSFAQNVKLNAQKFISKALPSINLADVKKSIGSKPFGQLLQNKALQNTGIVSPTVLEAIKNKASLPVVSTPAPTPVSTPAVSTPAPVVTTAGSIPVVIPVPPVLPAVTPATETVSSQANNSKSVANTPSSTVPATTESTPPVTMANNLVPPVTTPLQVTPDPALSLPGPIFPNYTEPMWSSPNAANIAGNGMMSFPMREEEPVAEQEEEEPEPRQESTTPSATPKTTESTTNPSPEHNEPEAKSSAGKVITGVLVIVVVAAIVYFGFIRKPQNA